MNQPWLAYPFAVAMLLVSVWCVSRLAFARGRGLDAEHDAELFHAAAGIALAVVLISGVHSIRAQMWGAFAAVGAGWWSVSRIVESLREPGAGRREAALRLVPYTVICAGGLFLCVAPLIASLATRGGMNMGHGPSAIGTSTATLPIVGLALAVCLVVQAVLTADRAVATSVVVCQIVMDVAMAYALISML